jgi:hypothetical protein
VPEYGNTREIGFYVLTPTVFSGRDEPSGMSCRSPLQTEIWRFYVTQRAGWFLHLPASGQDWLRQLRPFEAAAFQLRPGPG